MRTTGYGAEMSGENQVPITPPGPLLSGEDSNLQWHERTYGIHGMLGNSSYTHDTWSHAVRWRFTFPLCLVGLISGSVAILGRLVSPGTGYAVSAEVG